MNITTEFCVSIGGLLDSYHHRGPSQVKVRRMYEQGEVEEEEGNARIEVRVGESRRDELGGRVILTS